MQMTTTVPEGFAPHFRKSGLTDPWEPLYSRRDAGVIIALRAAEAQQRLRTWRTADGVTDNAMGLSCGETMRGHKNKPRCSLVR